MNIYITFLLSFLTTFCFGQKAIDTIYTSHPIIITETGEVYEGLQEVRTFQKKWSKEYAKIQKEETIIKVAAHPNIAYEMRKVLLEDGTVLHQIIIWRKEKERLLQEVAFFAKEGAFTSEKVAIDIARAKWITLCNAHNASQLIEQVYTQNTIYYNNDKPLLFGRTALTEAYSYMNRPTYQLALTPLHLSQVNERIAFEFGQCAGSYGGKYIIVWKKIEQGNWQVLFDSNY